MSIYNIYVSVLTIIASIVVLVFSFYIFRKIFNVKNKRPWIFISVSSLFLIFKQLLELFNIKILNYAVSEYIISISEFIGIVILAYALFLEYLVLKYYKGRFVRIKLIPVQEGTLIEEDIELNVTNGEAYLAYKKSKDFILGEFAKAVKKGYEGFLLTETPPKIIRQKYDILKTPIAWLIEKTGSDSSYYSENLTDNSDIVEPIRINDIVSNVDLFLGESDNPFIILELNEIVRINNSIIVVELISYLSHKIKSREGIFVVILNRDVDNSILSDFYEYLKELK